MQNYRLIRSMSSIRRWRVKIGLVIMAFALFHLISTGLFLINHFRENDNRSDMLKLDMTMWYGTTQSQKKIPRYIHQIWISSLNNEEMSEKWQVASNTCIKFHSNYNYTLWTHEKILLWLEKHYSWFIPLYQNYRYDMQRIDAMKYLLLFHFGGVYLDLDIKCKVQDIITAMVPYEQKHAEPDIIFHLGTEGISANTDIMAAKKFHPFFKLAISRLKSANRWFYLYHLTIILSAGPTYLYGIYRQFPLKETFYYIPNKFLYGKLIEGVGGGTWYGKDSLILIQLMENPFWASFIILGLIGLCFVMYIYLKKKRFL